MIEETSRIGIPIDLLDEVDAYVRLFGAFRSRQELVAYSIREFLDRGEENLGFAQ